MSFVHLHVHSEFSLLDGYATIEEIVRAAREHGSPAVGLTDHGVMAGTVQFLEAAGKHGVKPIVGCEIYVVDDRHKKEGRENQSSSHLTVLAINQEGYQNLLKIVSASHLEGFYYKPRADFQLLERYHAGLIVLSGCVSSMISRAILRGDEEEAIRLVDWYRERYRDRFFLEVQHHPGPDLERLERHIVDLSRKLGIPLVATNDVHYVQQGDSRWQSLLSKIAQSKEELPDDYYLKSPAEMSKIFQELPDAFENTLAIAEMVEPIAIPSRVEVPRPRGLKGNASEVLSAMVIEGLTRRYGDPPPPEYLRRAYYELEVINRSGFAEYILLVADICNYCRESGIAYGPRGSAGGSIVCHAVGISEPDPIAHGLIFERFLNPERIELPDIDMDLEHSRRGDVWDHLVRTYGSDKVAAIATYGTLGAKQALKDVARVLGIDYQRMDQITKRIPFGKKIAECVADGLVEMTEEIEPILTQAVRIEGKPRQVSTHAAGVVITTRPVVDLAPLMRSSDDRPQVQYDLDSATKAGLLKLDLLGLDNLTVVTQALELIQERHGKVIDLWNIPWDDPKVWSLLRRGRVFGVFQLGTGSGLRVTREVRPDKLDDLFDLVALNRPGPIEFVGKYARVKHGLESISSPHPLITNIVARTNGVILYQEQILEICRQVAGFSYGEADKLRKAIGKKIRELLDEQKEKFVEKAQKHSGIPKEEAEGIWSYFEPFARYGFNCLAGDTLVIRASGNQGNPSEITIARLYEVFHSNTTTGRKYRGRGVRILSRDSDGRIRPRRVVNVFKQGEKEVLEIRTRNGRVIRATADHLFLTPGGWSPVRDLLQGSVVLAHGGYESLPIDGRLSAGVRRGGGYRGEYGSLGSGFPGGEKNPGYVDGGSATFKRITTLLLEECEQRCMQCGSSGRLERHHRDGDRRNNTRENLEILCSSCHKKADYTIGKRRRRWEKGHLVVEDVVESIVPAGVTETYDLEMEAPEHNFVANGFVVHNCAHACSYGYLAYQTAWLKANYPLEFCCALLDVFSDKSEKVASGIAECWAMGIRVLPPDINHSEAGFAIEGEAIRFGLAAVKGIGIEIAEVIARNRPYDTCDELINLPKFPGKVAMESLARVGALPWGTRRGCLEFVQSKWSGIGKLARSQQLTMFTEAIEIPSVPEAPTEELLKWERDLLGVPLSVNTLQHVAEYATNFINDLSHGDEVSVIGEVRTVRRTMTKHNQEMCFGTIADLTGETSFVCFPRVHQMTSDLWVEGQLVSIDGKVGERNGDLQIVVSNAREFRIEDTPDEEEVSHPPVVTQFSLDDPIAWIEANDLANASSGPVPLALELVHDGVVQHRVERLVDPSIVAQVKRGST